MIGATPKKFSLLSARYSAVLDSYCKPGYETAARQEDDPFGFDWCW
jgi:hypothetical protein